MEITANALQTVELNQNVLFTDTPVCGSCSILHREGSGLVTLRGITNQCRARFKVFFSGNIALPADGTVEAISLAIAINGEPVASTTMIQTPAASFRCYGNSLRGVRVFELDEKNTDTFSTTHYTYFDLMGKISETMASYFIDADDLEKPRRAAIGAAAAVAAVGATALIIKKLIK